MHSVKVVGDNTNNGRVSFVNVYLCFMAGQKNPKEASNIFNSIIKASVNIPLPKKPYPDCLECSEEAKDIVSNKRDGKLIIYTYKCPNGHLFTEELTLK
ncbi:hypothetical protein ACCC92_26410 [Mucilaginibacter sp. Mucisp84]|uniref:hypothetical protein n=1 Tax=Mucilaginibacter sp. Mucisp84 TaxID=3243058 RepID=UPI0039A5DA54